MLLDLPCLKVLQVVCDGRALRLGRSQEVLHDWRRIISEGDLNWTVKPVRIPVVACSLIGFVLLHAGKQLLGGPAPLLGSHRNLRLRRECTSGKVSKCGNSCHRSRAIKLIELPPP